MNEPLYLKPKMGIVPELSMQTYETISQQIREIISNSLDANAESIKITLNRTKKGADLIIEDDGKGMGHHDFENEFLALGGSEKYDDKTKIGRIGIGFLAAIPLCHYIEIQSRKNGSNKAFIARLDCGKFTIDGLRTEEVKNIEIGEIISSTDDADKLGLPKHFTKIILIDLTTKAIEVFNDDVKLNLFIAELEKILPIEYDKTSPLFDLFSKNMKTEIFRLNQSNKIDVFLNSNKKLLRKVFEFKNINTVEAVREIIKEPIGQGMTVSGYLVATNKVLDENWRGLNLRVLNVTVEQGFMTLEGYESRKRYITGELYIEGINKNKAISINRNKFNEDYEQVRVLSKYVEDLIIDFQKGINTRWDVKSVINKKLKNIKSTNDAITEVSKAIGNVSIQKKSSQKKSSQSLSIYKAKKIFEEKDLIKDLNIDKKQKIGVTVSHDMKGADIKKDYVINWKDYEGFKADIKINSNLLEDAQRIIKIGTETYSCSFVEGKKEDNPCEINLEHKKIYFNLNHKLIASLEGQNILFAFIMEYSYKKSKTKEEFYELAISLLSDQIGKR
jgi:hypothetical protein